MRKNRCAVMRWFYIMQKLHRRNIPILPGLIHRFIRIVFSCDLPYTCEISENVILVHNGLGVVIHGKTKIGKNTSIYQNVTIGGRNGRGCPTIGEGVFIGAGAFILGGISIGDNSKIGANAVIIEDVPAGATVVGPLARIL